MNNTNSNQNKNFIASKHDVILDDLTLLEKINLWWSRFNLRSKLLAFGTLVVSFIMTLITFFALSSIQKDAGMNDTRYARDLGLLLSGNVTELVAKNQTRELFNVAEKFWRSSRNLRYIFFTDPDGFVKLGIPVSATASESDAEGALQLTRKLKLPSELKKQPQFPLVRQHSTPQGQVTDVFVPMLWKGEYLGTLALGVTPNKKALATAALTREITVAVFISIWVLVIIGAGFNALTITRPIRELVIGVREIAKGNFKSRVDLPMSGELGELLTGFNAMASRLEDYDAANIEELKAAQVKQQSLIATMADGALLLDEQGNIVLVNPTARRLFRWEGRNLEGQNLLNQLPDSLVKELETPITSLLNNFGDSDDLRCNLEEPPRTLRIVLKSVRDTTGENIKGIAVTVQDLTREVQLNAAQKRFISNVSHELRTPLFNIKSYVETLYDLGEQLTKDEQKEFLGVANSETDRLTRLVNDVLDLSKLESGRTIQLEALSIKEAMEQTLRNYKLNAEEKNVKLTLNVENNLTFVLGKWDMLLQVFDNLVGNDALSALGYVFPYMFIIMGLTFGLGAGVTAVIARFIGQQSKLKADIASGQTILMGIVISIGIIIFTFFFKEDIFLIQNADQSVVNLASGYFNILSNGAIFLVFSMFIRAILSGEGDNLFPMKVLGIGTILNIIFDPIFMLDFSRY